MIDLAQVTRFWQFHNNDTDVASTVVSSVLSPARFSTLNADGEFHHSIQIVQIGDIYV